MSLVGLKVQATFPVKLNGIKLNKEGILINNTGYIPIRELNEKQGNVVNWLGLKDGVEIFTQNYLQNPYPKHQDYEIYSVSIYKPNQVTLTLANGNYPSNLIMNGTFTQWIQGKGFVPLGIVKINGSKLSDRIYHVPPRPVIAWNDNEVKIIDRAELENISFPTAIGGGPLLLPYKSDMSEYKAISPNYKRPRSCVGITKDGLMKFIFVHSATINELIPIGQKEGCEYLLNMDGGKPAILRRPDGSVVREPVEPSATYFVRK